MSDSRPLVALSDVSKRHRRGALGLRGGADALRSVSLTIGRGEIVGVVGETGAGKSTLGRLSVALERPSAGTVLFDEVDIGRARGRTLRLMRQHAQLVDSDPMAQLDPARSIAATLEAPLRIHERLPRVERRRRADDLLTMVGLNPALGAARPHALSAGQCQRVAIARALAGQPRYLVLDEATALLDQSIEAQILNLVVALRERFNLAVMLITSDMRVARYMCDRIAVMHLGRIVEQGPAEEICSRPRHPLTRALVAAVADPGLSGGAIPLVRGEPPDALQPPPGCSFHPRCPSAGARCREDAPRETDAGGVMVACHLNDGGVERGA